MSAEMLDAMDEIFVNANRLIAGVADDQWEDKTPCTEWDVRALVNHMATTTTFFGHIASRTAPTDPPDSDLLGDDPSGSYSARSSTTAAAWRGDGATDGMVDQPAEMPAVAALGVVIIDIGTHCWDLAMATNQDVGLSPEVIGMIDTWNRNVISEDVRAGGGFGSVLDGPGDQLGDMLAYVGREV